jgi:hypothetical protein
VTRSFLSPVRRPLALVLAWSLLCGPNCATVRPYRVANYFRSPKVAGLDIKRVAVLPFENLTGEKAAAAIAAEEFNLQLGRTGLFDLIERGRIEELWREQDLDTMTRFDASTAVRIGRMLGAQAVILGSVTKFVPHPQLKPDTTPLAYDDRHHHHDAPPVVVIDNDRHDDAWQTCAAVLAIVSVVGIVFLLTRPKAPAAEVGIQARLVDVESGGARRVQALVEEREDRNRLVVDIEYLTQVLCRELVGTLQEVENAE